MSEENYEKLITQIIDKIVPVIREEIKVTVNGKIDYMQIQNKEMEKKLDVHIENVKPMLDLIQGSIVARKVILWVTSILLAIGTTYTMIKNIDL